MSETLAEWRPKYGEGIEAQLGGEKVEWPVSWVAAAYDAWQVRQRRRLPRKILGDLLTGPWIPVSPLPKKPAAGQDRYPHADVSRCHQY
jgi:hypothetical protein